jgi:general secretion pathway protein G
LTAPANTANWRGPYVTRLPNDPWNRPFVYRCPSPTFPQGFRLLSKGPDGIDGTDDDISNESMDEILEENGARFSIAHS